MKLNSGEFETRDSGSFEISITQESDCSNDGGYSFENVTNTYELDVASAKCLIRELQYYVSSHDNSL